MANSPIDGGQYVRPAKKDGQQSGPYFEPLLVDPTTGALIVTGAGAAPAATSLRIQDGAGTNLAAVDAQGRLQVSAPAGAATEATLATRATEATAEAIRAVLADSIAPDLDDIKRGLTDFEVRLDYDANGRLEYASYALDNSSTTAEVWTVKRLYRNAEGKTTRVRVRSGLAYDSKTVGW